MGSYLSRRQDLGVELGSDWERSSCQVEQVLTGQALLLQGLLSPKECTDFMELMASGHDVLDIQLEHRVCRRLVSRQDRAMEQLWERVRGVMAEQGLLRLQEREGSDWEAVGLNEVVRVVRYGPGGCFKPHCDAPFTRSVEERSWWTLNIYLNTVEKEAEGATVFLGNPRCTSRVPVQPQAGAGLLFFQPPLLHEGQPLLYGDKWLLRTDVMFRREQEVGPEETEARRLHKEATELELEGRGGEAWPLYARAFKLWPPLERDSYLG